MSVHDLFALKEHKMKLGLKPTFDALETLGNVHKHLRFLHVTGTNGKGSTCAFLADTLQLAGYRVGLFTSPHLVRFNERIQINRQEISDEELEEYIDTIKKTGVALTFFEYATVIALLHFARHKVDFVVWEVGLGGTLDSTNVVDAEYAIITPIGFDHTHILGDTIEKISRDKCGIIKKDCVVVTCEGNAGLPWIREKSANNKLIIAPPYDGTIGLAGDFQKINAGIAFAVLRDLGISTRIIRRGIATARWPGRLEYIDENILADCAHNPAGIDAVRSYVERLPKKRLILVFGVLGDKDYLRMIELLPQADVVILTKPQSERAIDPCELPFENARIIDEPYQAYLEAKKLQQPGDLVFIVGSCYLVGNIKEKLQYGNGN